MRLLTTCLMMVAFFMTSCQSSDSGNTADQKTSKKSEKAAKQKNEDEKKYDTVHYGEKVEEGNALSLKAVLDSMGDKSEYRAKVKGDVTAVCQKKGCWMKMEKSDGNAIRISFKDYGFFVPKNLTGEKVVMRGRAYYDTIPVKRRRHFARDEGKSEDEVKSITDPKIQTAFKAEGVKILQ